MWETPSAPRSVIYVRIPRGNARVSVLTPCYRRGSHWTHFVQWQWHALVKFNSHNHGTVKRGYFEHFWTLRYDIIYVRTNIRGVHGLVTKESYASLGPLWFLCRYFLFQWYFSSKCDCSKLPRKSYNIEHPGVTLNNTVLIVIWYIYTPSL